MIELDALRTVDFNWTMHIKSVWNNAGYDVSELNGRLRSDVMTELDKLTAAHNSLSSLGWVIIGEAGAGKTHFLGAIRNQTALRGAGFILIDMTDVHDFWETILLGFLNSLQQPYLDGKPQYQILTEYLLNKFKSDKPIPQVKKLQPSTERKPQSQVLIEHAINFIKRIKPIQNVLDNLLQMQKVNQPLQPVMNRPVQGDRERIIEETREILDGLNSVYPTEMREYQNVIRALMLLNSKDFSISTVGYSWLQGLRLEDDDKKLWQFTTHQEEAKKIIKGFSWIMSLRGPVILALDQLDSIVAQRYVSGGTAPVTDITDEQRVSLSIIQGIAGGLMALRDMTCRTLTLVACLDSTWGILCTKALKSASDRYKPPSPLYGITSAIAKEIVARRLSDAYKRINFSPPYPTWPFKEEAFETAKGLSPRAILQYCDKHLEKCLNEKTITELTSFHDSPMLFVPSDTSEDYTHLTNDFERLRRQVNPSALLDELMEDELLGKHLQTACRCLIKENPTPDNVDALLDIEFAGGKIYPPLHARIRLIYHEEGDREKHFCFRAILRTNATAYQARLKAAMTASGIDRNLSFRHLIIIRNTETPSGVETKKLFEQFTQHNGIVVNPSDDELRTLFALEKLEEKNVPHFDSWLKTYKPASNLSFMKIGCVE